MEALGALGFVLLALHVAAHVALVVVVARTARASPSAAVGRAALALFFPPLGAVWAWDAGARKRVAAYGGTLAAFALVLFAITIVSAR